MNKLQQLFGEKRSFSRFEALYYLRQLAMENNNDVLVSLAKLAQDFGGDWGKRKVHAFMHELEECGEIEILSAGREGTKFKFTVQVKNIPTVKVETEVIVPPPTLAELRAKEKEDKKEAEKVKQEEAAGFDFTKIDWAMKDKVASICLYDAYLKAFPSYCPKNEDMAALTQIVYHLKHAVEAQRKIKPSMSNLNSEVLAKCKAFVAAIKDHTKYGGYELTWIANRYNQIISTIQISKTAAK